MEVDDTLKYIFLFWFMTWSFSLHFYFLEVCFPSTLSFGPIRASRRFGELFDGVDLKYADTVVPSPLYSCITTYDSKRATIYEAHDRAKIVALETQGAQGGGIPGM